MAPPPLEILGLSQASKKIWRQRDSNLRPPSLIHDELDHRTTVSCFCSFLFTFQSALLIISFVPPLLQQFKQFNDMVICFWLQEGIRNCSMQYLQISNMYMSKECQIKWKVSLYQLVLVLPFVCWMGRCISTVLHFYLKVQLSPP